MHRTIQLVEITNAYMRPLEFTFKVSVTGRVERQNSGYDAVHVNGVHVFSGSNEGLECQMANKAGDVLVKVQAPPGELTLSYDTVDAHFHVGAFARVTDVEMMDVNTNAIKVELKGTTFPYLSTPVDNLLGVWDGDEFGLRVDLAPALASLPDNFIVWHASSATPPTNNTRQFSFTRTSTG